MTSRPRHPRRHEQGSATLELVVWTPGLLLVMGMLVVAGRMNTAHAAVEQAADDAARTASVARTAQAARSRALAAAQQAFTAQRLSCTVMTVNVDTSGFALPPGKPATVTATVSCTVRLADLGIDLLPTRVVTATSVSTLDTFRERS